MVINRFCFGWCKIRHNLGCALLKKIADIFKSILHYPQAPRSPKCHPEHVLPPIPHESDILTSRELWIIIPLHLSNVFHLLTPYHFSVPLGQATKYNVTTPRWCVFLFGSRLCVRNRLFVFSTSINCSLHNIGWMTCWHWIRFGLEILTAACA